MDVAHPIRRPILPVNPQIVNYPIQATCSDFLKLSLKLLWFHLQPSRLEANIVLSAYDEIVVECPPNWPTLWRRFCIQLWPRKKFCTRRSQWAWIRALVTVERTNPNPSPPESACFFNNTLGLISRNTHPLSKML